MLEVAAIAIIAGGACVVLSYLCCCKESESSFQDQRRRRPRRGRRAEPRISVEDLERINNSWATTMFHAITTDERLEQGRHVVFNEKVRIYNPLGEPLNLDAGFSLNADQECKSP